MSDAATAEIVTYKGRQYKQLYVGQYEFGRRAKLQFLSSTGSENTFWCNADEVTEGQPQAVTAGVTKCPNCDRYFSIT